MDYSSAPLKVTKDQEFVLTTTNQSADVEGTGLNIKLFSVSYACKKPNPPFYHIRLGLQSSENFEEQRIMLEATSMQKSFRLDWKGWVITALHATDAQVRLKVEDLTAALVLERYKEEDLPAFAKISLIDVNQAGNFGERPLDVAATRGNVDEIGALLRGGADVNAPGELGNTPLHEAVGQGYLEAVKFLLAHGASCTIKNQFGQTSLDIAKMGSRKDIVKLLNEAFSNGH